MSRKNTFSEEKRKKGGVVAVFVFVVNLVTIITQTKHTPNGSWLSPCVHITCHECPRHAESCHVLAREEKALEGSLGAKPIILHSSERWSDVPMVWVLGWINERKRGLENKIK